MGEQGGWWAEAVERRARRVEEHVDGQGPRSDVVAGVAVTVAIALAVLFVVVVVLVAVRPPMAVAVAVLVVAVVVTGVASRLVQRRLGG